MIFIDQLILTDDMKRNETIRLEIAMKTDVKSLKSRKVDLIMV